MHLAYTNTLKYEKKKQKYTPDKPGNSADVTNIMVSSNVIY